MSCEVCTSPSFGVAHAMLECGASPAEISEQTGLELSAVEWHAANCVRVVEDEEPDSLEKSDVRIRDLAARIAVAGTSAGLQGDVKSQLLALSAALRAEQEIRRSLEERAKNAPKSGNDEPLTIAKLDLMVKNYLETTAEESLCRFCGQPKPKKELETHAVTN
jgi:hypothetical protein